MRKIILSKDAPTINTGKLSKRQICFSCPYTDKVEVPYEGSKDVDILILGESPGNEEIKFKRPFCGKSGILLEKLLELINLNRSLVFITNSARCKIDKEEDSIKDINIALKNCRHFLDRAIKEVKPRLIISLGAYALKQTLSMQKILSNRGKFVYSEEFGCYVFITVHPAYVLRGASKGYPNKPYTQMSMKEKLLFTDFKLIRRFIDNDFNPPKISTKNYKEIHDFKEFRNTKLFSFDFETTGLDLHDKNTEVLSVSISKEKGKSGVYFLNE